MELAENLSVSISLPVSGQLGCRVIMFKDLAEFMSGRFYTAPYCASHVILLRYWTPFHNYGLVTGTFPEHSWNPIYMHLCHIFFVSIYFRNLPSPSLVVRWLVENWRCNMYYLGLTHLIAGSAPSCNLIIAYLLPVYVCRFRVLRLEVQFVLLWPAYLYHTRIHI